MINHEYDVNALYNEFENFKKETNQNMKYLSGLDLLKQYDFKFTIKKTKIKYYKSIRRRGEYESLPYETYKTNIEFKNYNLSESETNEFANNRIPGVYYTNIKIEYNWDESDLNDDYNDDDYDDKKKEHPVNEKLIKMTGYVLANSYKSAEELLKSSIENEEDQESFD